MFGAIIEDLLRGKPKESAQIFKEFEHSILC
jgi:hypothetical protein